VSRSLRFRKSSAASWPVWRREAVERALRVVRHGGGRMCLAEVDPDIEVVLTADGAEEAVLRNLGLSFLGCDLVSGAEAKRERPERLKGITALEVRGARDDDADQDA
jgi:hypothetical protein